MSEAQPSPIETDVARWKRTIEAVPLKADVPFLLDAIRRNQRAGRVRATGLPSSTSGAGGGDRGKGGVTDPVGETASTAVDAERGALDADDPLFVDVRAATSKLEEAALALGEFAQIVNGMRREMGGVPDVQFCEACADAGVRHPWDRYARDLRGLVMPVHLCEGVYQFVSKRGRLPSGEEARYYAEKGRWKIRIDPTATAGSSVGVPA